MNYEKVFVDEKILYNTFFGWYDESTNILSNQLNNFLALMNNFQHATEATNTALESQGSANRENSRYMESLNKMGLLKRI